MNQDNVSHLNRDPRFTGGLTPRPPFGRDTGQAPRKFVAKGHDAQLQDAQMGRLPTTLTLVSGAVFTGIITKRDKYTITLRHESGSAAGMDEIFYKHAIEGVLIDRRDNAPQGQ